MQVFIQQLTGKTPIIERFDPCVAWDPLYAMHAVNQHHPLNRPTWYVSSTWKMIDIIDKYMLQAYGGSGDSLSCATSCLSQAATSSTPASPSQSTFSIKVMSEQISFSSDPPYIKEGLVRRKHLFESSDRKAKNREWRRCLLIVSDGQLKIYQWRHASGDIGYKGMHRENSVNSTAAIPRSSGSEEKGWDVSCLFPFFLTSTVRMAIIITLMNRQVSDYWDAFHSITL